MVMVKKAISPELLHHSHAVVTPASLAGRPPASETTSAETGPLGRMPSGRSHGRDEAGLRHIHAEGEDFPKGNDR